MTYHSAVLFRTFSKEDTRNRSCTCESWPCDSSVAETARSIHDGCADFLLVPQGYVVKYECIRLLSHTIRVEEAVGEGVTRCTSTWCVYCLVAIDCGVSHLVLYYRAT